MNNDGEQSSIEIIRGMILELVKVCEDADLLDLVYKLLIQV